MIIKNILTFTGLWLLLPATLVFIYGVKTMDISGVAETVITNLLIVISLCCVIKTIITNIQRYRYGHRDFSLKDAIGRGNREIREGKVARSAMYPPVPSNYQSSVPKDLVLGRYNGKYVYCPLGDDGVMSFVIGAPGANKTVLILSWLYTVFHQKRIYGNKTKQAGRRWNFVVVDIKGEIFQKLIKVKGKYKATGKERLHVFQPSNRLSYGWDVFYQLRGKNVTPTERLRALVDIANGLVEEPKGNTNSYFPNNAKKILVGIMFYYSSRGEDFIEIIRRINETPMDVLIKKIVDDARMQNDRITLDFLAGFVGKKDNESIQDVESTMKTSLQCFIFPDIEYALKNNPYRTSPRVLNNGKTSIDIAIDEAFLEAYQPVFRLICVQVLRHCVSEFTEYDRRMTSFIFDEAAAIKRISSIENTMSTCRSRHTNVFLIVQNRNQFDDIYGKELSESILNLCELKIFLSNGGDKDTETYVQTMAGKYIDRKRSYSKEGISIKNTNYSEEERQIVDGKELMSLRSKKEMIVFIYGEYFRIKKFMYYKDRYLSPIAKEIKNHNDRYALVEERSDDHAREQEKRPKTAQNSNKNRKTNGKAYQKNNNKGKRTGSQASGKNRNKDRNPNCGSSGSLHSSRTR